MKNAVALCLMTCALATRLSAQITLQSQVLSVYPPQNATSVPLHDSLVVQFAPDMNIVAQSLSDTTFVIQAQQSGWHRGTVTYSPQSHTATLKPVKPFFVGELVTAVATKFIQYDSAGVVKNIRGFAWQFYGKVTAKSYGTMSFVTSFAVPGDMFNVETVSDLDNDGRNDLSVYSNDSARFYFNSGDGLHFVEKAIPNQGNMFSFNFTNSPYQDIWGTETFCRNIDGRHFAIGNAQTNGFTNPYPLMLDANMDGTPDLMGGGTGDSALLFLVRDSTIVERRMFNIGLQWGEVVLVTDYNNDGLLDVIMPPRQLLNDGAGHFLAAPFPPLGGGSLVAGDFDGDGWVDLAEAGVGELTLYHNNQNGTFTKIPTGIDYQHGLGITYGITCSDFDGNGALDVAYTLGTGAKMLVFVALNDGAGHFRISQMYQLPGGGNVAYLKAADIDGNGTIDIITGYHDAQQVVIFRNDSAVSPMGVEGSRTPTLQPCSMEDVFPDPVIQSANVFFFVPNRQPVHLQVITINGEVVVDVLNAICSAGTHSIQCDLKLLANGTYFVRMNVGDSFLMKPFTIAR